MSDNEQSNNDIKNSRTRSRSRSPRVYDPHDIRGPRIFEVRTKMECWNKSAIVIGRDPYRWRLDAVGLPVLNQLRGCMGKFCHTYDHIYPYSKGGKTTLENCQVLQTSVNLAKSNKVELGFGYLRNAA